MGRGEQRRKAQEKKGKKQTGAAGKAETVKAASGERKATAETEPTLPLHELFREGEVPVLEVGIVLPAGEELPPGVSAYYRSLAGAYLRVARERLLAVTVSPCRAAPRRSGATCS